jgi:protein-S-isoprenylcysteine O-methyltransferase Ste14
MPEVLSAVFHSSLFPLIALGGLLVVTAAKSFWLQAVHRTAAFVIDYRDPVLGFVGRVFAIVTVSLLVYFCAIAAWPAVETASGQLFPVTGTPLRPSGVVIMAAALLWTCYAQISMGASWRIGIPQDKAPPLRTAGPFSVSRNPIFLGMLLFMIGAAVWSPNAVTLVLLACAYISLEIQIRCEEAFLMRQHGDSYVAYRSRVGRWL